MLMKTLQPFDWAAMSIDEMSKLHTEVQTALSQRIIARIDELQARLERLSVPAKDVKAKRFYPEVRPKYRDPRYQKNLVGPRQNAALAQGQKPRRLPHPGLKSLSLETPGASIQLAPRVLFVYRSRNKESHPMRRALFPVILSPVILLTACVPVALGAGAGYVGLQDRPVGVTTEDTGLKIGIKNNLAHVQANWLSDIGIDVYYGDVLLTGIVATREEGEKVLDIVRRTDGVKRVYNELFVGAAYSAAQRARDGWIAAQIQPRLLGAQDAFPLNYLITVVNNNVYIMGSAGSPAEHEHVLHVLRTTKGVAQVHDYLVVANKNTINQPDVKTNTFGSTPSHPADPLADSKMD